MKKYLAGLLVACGLLGAPAAWGEIHALIMTIGDYQGGITRLKGVAHDVESARSIARLMGVKDENTQLLHDGQLTLEGMHRAFDDLDKRVVSGDKVFIYYSGHGSRQRVKDPEERCAESLISVDGQGFTDSEIEARLKRLSGRALKIITLFDSCHSGGVATRGVPGKAKFVPKFWAKGGSEACEKPVNVLTRGIRLASNSPGSGGGNYIYIAAANDNEVSLDQPGKGGLATQAWLKCMSGQAVDANGSGGLTVEEIRVCAQKIIDAQIKGSQDFLPQHLTVVGNAQMVMTLAPVKSEVAQEKPPIPEAKPPVAPDVAPGAASGVASGAPATLLDVYHGRDDKRVVEITPARNKLEIGKDKFSFTLRSSHAGYVYLLMAGSDGKTFDLLFPNKLDMDNYIPADQPRQFPRPSWELVAQGPAGRDHILAIVSDAPRDLAGMPMTNAGPFSVVQVTSGGKRGIQLVTSSTSVAQKTECAETRKRNLAVSQTIKPVCSEGYGAALVEITEVE